MDTPPKAPISNCSTKRLKVSFGNPALGTYSGSVYIFDESNSIPHNEAQAGNCAVHSPASSSLVAMIHVPPDQVPEGILTLARAHRQNFRHVRIVTTTSSELDLEFKSEDTQCREEPATLVSASDFNEQQQQDIQQEFKDTEETQDLATKLTMSYLILFELSSPDAARIFVEDLDGKPYTSLQPDEICHVHHVANVQGDDGVCIMSPFFASSYANLQQADVGASSSPTTTPAKRTSKHSEGHSRDQALPPRPFPQEDTQVGLYECSTVSSPSTAIPSASASFEVLCGEHSTSSPAGVGSPMSTATEVQNCAVCLESMIPSTEPILTTVCNHSFHLDCLLRWQDSPCPVCRYDHSGLNETLSQCHVCGTTVNNYVCLICGVVSCAGGPNLSCSASDDDDVLPEDSLTALQSNQPALAGHARRHYEQTLHAYALETGTQHVWDFAGGGYVHRLIRNAGDGKLVEVNDPLNTTSNERTLSPGLSDAQEEQLMHRKLESSANQYYTLLKSQLEQQRIYYEGRLTEMHREYDQKRKTKFSAADLIAALKQERNQLEQRCMTLQRKNHKVSEELAFLKSMSESMHQNKSLMQQHIENAQRERSNAQEMMQRLLPPLESKVAMLMQQLDGGDFGSGNGAGNHESDGLKPKAKKR